MKKEHIIPLLGTLISMALCWAVIHFWAAAWYGRMAGISREAAYWYLMALLVLFQGWRIWLIVKGKDDVTRMINRWRRK